MSIDGCVLYGFLFKFLKWYKNGGHGTGVIKFPCSGKLAHFLDFTPVEKVCQVPLLYTTQDL